MASIDTNIFIGTQDGIYLYGGGTVWLSRNNGLFVSDTSWIESCIFTKSDSLLFANILSVSSYTSGIYVTSDLGQNWTKINNNDFSESSVNDITVNNKFLFAGTNNGGWRMQIPNMTVPVEFTSFTATVNVDKVILNWSTASETNNNGFEIERKFSSAKNTFVDWEGIGFLEGKGSTTEQQFYNYTDRHLEGKYLYRLKQVDFDGSIKYSKIIEVKVEIPKEFLLSQNYPNPFNPTTSIRYFYS